MRRQFARIQLWLLSKVDKPAYEFTISTVLNSRIARIFADMDGYCRAGLKFNNLPLLSIKISTVFRSDSRKFSYQIGDNKFTVITTILNGGTILYSTHRVLTDQNTNYYTLDITPLIFLKETYDGYGFKGRFLGLPTDNNWCNVYFSHVFKCVIKANYKTEILT